MSEISQGFEMTTQKQICNAFFDVYCIDRSKVKRLPDRDWPTDVRVSFCDYVDYLCRNGTISPELAQRVTLR